VLRHTFATQLIRVGVDPVLVADLLRRAGVDTLRVYTNPTTPTGNVPWPCSPPTPD